MAPDLLRGVIRWCTALAIQEVAIAAVICLTSGRFDWLWGWALLAVVVAFDISRALVLIPRHPDLLNERGKVLPGSKKWDRWMYMLGISLLPFAALILSGLDERFGWRPAMPLAGNLAGLAVSAAGYALALWAMAANRFFSTIVRIQTERGHTVVTGGPYRFVRHPGYVGVILTTVAMPVSLGSWWAVIPALLAVFFLVLRTALEDRILIAELPGYGDYIRQTRYRLIPGIW